MLNSYAFLLQGHEPGHDCPGITLQLKNSFQMEEETGGRNEDHILWCGCSGFGGTMTVNTYDKLRFTGAIKKVRDLMEELDKIYWKLEQIGDIEAKAFNALPSVKVGENRPLENIIIYKEDPQEEKLNKKYQLLAARMELELSLTTAFSCCKPSTLSLIRDCFILCPGEKELKQKYVQNYRSKLRRNLKGIL